MHSNITIQNELKELNSMLAGVSNENVYTVPDGYFDVLPHDILMGIQQQAPQAEENGSVPAGYFDALADSIMGKIKAGITGEAEDPAILSGLKNINVYNVPAGYFDGLAGSISNKIKMEAVEEDGNSVLLDSVKSINVYSVPAGYFNNLAADIVNKLPQPAKVIVMKKRSSFFNYAAAAVITGLIGLSVISTLDKQQSAEKALPSAGITAAIVKDGIEIAQNNSFDEVLSTVSDNDIVNYLKQNGQDVNAALVASASDDKNLPEEVDYMTDDKTLDNLLNELNIAQPATN